MTIKTWRAQSQNKSKSVSRVWSKDCGLKMVNCIECGVKYHTHPFLFLLFKCTTFFSFLCLMRNFSKKNNLCVSDPHYKTWTPSWIPFDFPICATHLPEAELINQLTLLFTYLLVSFFKRLKIIPHQWTKVEVRGFQNFQHVTCYSLWILENISFYYLLHTATHQTPLPLRHHITPWRRRLTTPPLVTSSSSHYCIFGPMFNKKHWDV